MGWEFDILYALQEIHHPVLDVVMTVLTTLGNAGILWILLGLVFACIPKYRQMGFQMLAAMLVTFIIGNLILKNLVARERPCWVDESIPLLVSVPSDYSFPSGHTMNGLTASLTMLFYDKRLGVPAVILASLIAFSRLYHFVHFPTDVLGGLVIGICAAVAVQVLFQAHSKKQS